MTPDAIYQAALELSAEAIEALARRLDARAHALRAIEPSYRLALDAGIKDHSYPTVRYGRVASYGGEAVITMADGRRWRAIGHGPTGDAEYIGRDGYIEFVPLRDEPAPEGGRA